MKVIGWLFIFLICWAFGVGCEKPDRTLKDSSAVEDTNEAGKAGEVRIEDEDVGSRLKREIAQYALKYKGEWEPRGRTLLAIDNEELYLHVNELTADALQYVKTVRYVTNSSKEIPDFRMFSDLQWIIVTGDSITDISNLEGVSTEGVAVFSDNLKEVEVLRSIPRLKSLFLKGLQCDSVTFVENMELLEEIVFSGLVNVRSLPDFQKLSKLRVLKLDFSGFATLENVETIINPFVLSVWKCDSLEDINALKESRIKLLIIDKESESSTYNRFSKWFDVYQGEIARKNPEFTVQFYLGE